MRRKLELGGRIKKKEEEMDKNKKQRKESGNKTVHLISLSSEE